MHDKVGESRLGSASRRPPPVVGLVAELPEQLVWILGAVAASDSVGIAVEVAAGQQHAGSDANHGVAQRHEEVGNDVADRPTGAKRLAVPILGRDARQLVGETEPLGRDELVGCHACI